MITVDSFSLSLLYRTLRRLEDVKNAISNARIVMIIISTLEVHTVHSVRQSHGIVQPGMINTLKDSGYCLFSDSVLFVKTLHRKHSEYST